MDTPWATGPGGPGGAGKPDVEPSEPDVVRVTSKYPLKEPENPGELVMPQEGPRQSDKRIDLLIARRRGPNPLGRRFNEIETLADIYGMINPDWLYRQNWALVF